jgi:phage-related protein (TIGR01555 family)
MKLFFNFLVRKKKKEASQVEPKKSFVDLFAEEEKESTTDSVLAQDKLRDVQIPRTIQIEQFFKGSIRREAKDDAVTITPTTDGALEVSTMDSLPSALTVPFTNGYTSLPNSILSYFGTQSFIGYQACGILAQNWLILKCCHLPALDATRNGYQITVNDGTEVAPEVLDELVRADVRYNVKKAMTEFITKGNIFGVRIAMFKVDSADKYYYEKPFNFDGVQSGSYKGIVQIDPYWVAPELDFDACADPTSLFFYEPTYWRVSGKRIHRSHLIIFKYGELADILRPTYLYGGIPLPQLLFTHVYNAERTSDEGPQLALTKRIGVLKTDIGQAAAKPGTLRANLELFAEMRDNYGTKTIGYQDDYQQFDTSLADLDAVIMTQYQIVAAVANIPVTKLMGTVPKGFNSTGEHEEASYHEYLETLQSEYLTLLLERHHALVIRSEIAPKFGIAPFGTTVSWNPLDAPTGEETAALNKAKAETGSILINSGAISPDDERQRVINDPDSGYNGLEDVLAPLGGDPEEDPLADLDFDPLLEQNVQEDPENEPLGIT